MSHVPTWVYILFLALLYLGIKRCFTRTMPVDRLALAPLIFIFLSLRSNLSLFGVGLGIILSLILGALCGMLIGHLQVKNRTILADKTKKLIQIPGDISMLIMIMAIFFIEFFIHYAIDAHWQISANASVRILAIVLSGVVVGISVGRNLTYYWKFMHAHSQSLEKS